MIVVLEVDNRFVSRSHSDDSIVAIERSVGGWVEGKGRQEKKSNGFRETYRRKEYQ